jgi:hypothetical protein
MDEHANSTKEAHWYTSASANSLCMLLQVAIKISRLILPDDLSVNIQHKPWHGKQPTTLTAVTLFIATQLGSRVMRPGLPVRSVTEVNSLCSGTDICNVWFVSRSRFHSV